MAQATLQDYGFFPGRSLLPDRLRLSLSFAPERPAEDVARFSDGDWIGHFSTQNYDGRWDVLPLRAPAGATHPVLQIVTTPGAKAFCDTALLASSPHLREVLAAFACPLRSVRLMRLAPGSRLKEHTDHDLGFEDGSIRLHIPITTNPDVDFRMNGTRVAMEAGSVWYLRLCDPHSVDNRGATERVHMVLDAELNDWMKALVNDALNGAG
jgi:hypothetical protein